MDIELLPQHWVSILALCIMVGSIIIALLKKWMITYVIIVANFVVFVLTVIFPSEIIGGSQYAGLGFRPIYLSFEYSPQLYTFFTSIFIHSSVNVMHIIGNMFIFFFVGTALEQRIGSKKFIVIYLLTGICGTLAHSFLNLGSPITLIGASGAIFGILGALAFAYPWDEVVMPIPVGIMFITRIKVIYAALIFAAIETFIVWLSVEDNTAHFAHLGGLVGGIILAALIIKTKKEFNNKYPNNIKYYDSFTPQKPKKINFSNLKKLAITDEQKDMLKRIENEDVPQVRDIWLEHFLEKTKCPVCGKALNHFNKKIWCEDNHFRTEY